MPSETRRSRFVLTPRERRGEVVAILAAALARLPAAAPIPHVPGAENSPESSQKALEVSRNLRLSVGSG